MTSPADLVPVPPVADELGELFERAGHQLHLVGGSVRDALLGRPSEDLDFATDARPERVLELVAPVAESTWTTGIDFGTIGARVRGTHVEITTYRADRYDRVSRNPLVRYGDSLADDLRRRDFTMNAMALSVPGHVFTDPYGGLRDLATGALRTPADPAESFADDPLRMLRAARFVAQLGVTPTAERRRRDDRDGGADRPDHRGAGAGRAVQAGARRAAAPRAGAAGRLRPGRRRAAGAAGAADGDRRAPPAQGRLRALADRAGAGDRAGGAGRAGPGAAAGRAAARHRQAGDAAARAGRRGVLPPPRGGRREAGAGPAAGAALPQGRRRGRRPADPAAPALPRVRRRASGPTPRSAATSPTPGRCWTGCTSWSARTAPPATSGGRRRWRTRTTRWRSGSAASRPRRTCARSVRTWTATRSCGCSGCRPARWSGRPGGT